MNDRLITSTFLFFSTEQYCDMVNHDNKWTRSNMIMFLRKVKRRGGLQ